MKNVRLLAGVCLFLFFINSIQSKASLAIEEFGVLIQSATFWIGTPEKSGAMAFLKIPEGTKVKILGEEGEYYRINHKDLIGYVDSKTIRKIEPGSKENLRPFSQRSISERKTVPSPPRISGPGYYLITDRTSLREKPDSQAAVLLRLPEQGRVRVLESSGKYWWKVKYKGTTGWAKAALLWRE